MILNLLILYFIIIYHNFHSLKRVDKASISKNVIWTNKNKRHFGDIFQGIKTILKLLAIIVPKVGVSG